jgi:hypothetical protein
MEAALGPRGYFCQVRFLWRCKRSFFRRLCLLIFAFRRFFNEPIAVYCRAPGTRSNRCLPQLTASACRSVRKPRRTVKPALVGLVEQTFLSAGEGGFPAARARSPGRTALPVKMRIPLPIDAGPGKRPPDSLSRAGTNRLSLPNSLRRLLPPSCQGPWSSRSRNAPPSHTQNPP